jgi:hypothetical protein
VAYAAGSVALEALDHALRHDTPRIGLWLDTSDHRPEDTVDAISSAA